MIIGNRTDRVQVYYDLRMNSIVLNPGEVYLDGFVNRSDHSQYYEASFLIKFFDENPAKYKFLVDVGAFGIELSNTYDLIMQRNWGGILIEPMPVEQFYKPLEDAVRERGNVKIFNIGISDYEGVTKGYIHSVFGQSSLVFNQETIDEIEVEVTTLPKLLQRENVPADFDLLSVDAEGLDYRIIKYLLEESDYHPTVIVAEKENQLFKHYGLDIEVSEETIENGKIFDDHGYSLIFETTGNKIFVRR